MSTVQTINVVYRSIDGCRESKDCVTIEAARDFAHYWIGAHPDLGHSYAVSDDGIGKITVTGATLRDLFPGS